MIESGVQKGKLEGNWSKNTNKGSHKAKQEILTKEIQAYGQTS